jgi:cardiolipin synthase
MNAINWGEFPLLGFAHVVISSLVTVHVLLKKHERAAIAWIGLVWLAPYLGPLVYFLFGINRIQRKAGRLRKTAHAALPRVNRPLLPLPEGLGAEVGDLVRLGQSVHPQPFIAGNAVEPLINGDQAYPAMLESIASAQRSVALSTYIFDRDRAGRRFVEALSAASQKGAEVRVLLDGVGTARFPTGVDADLEDRGVRTARFIPRRLGRYLRFINLRNHRKILVVDGRTAFLGGLNIREGHLVSERPRKAIQDVHFLVRGPVIDQVSEVFEEDWEFSSGEAVALPRWPGGGPGKVHARVIADGPDVDFEKLQWILVGALSVAKRSARILTPYFLPNEIVTNALQLAAMRGVRVDVLIPERSDLWFIDWAVRANFERLLAHGVRVHLNPPPFDHGKLFLVDEDWALIGSSNWDARSLRLNFEINMEVIDPVLCWRLASLFEEKKRRSREARQEEVAAWPVAIRLRNNLLRLLSPYL